MARKKTKYVYFFAGGKAEGKAGMKELLGGKGANLAEMSNLGLPVPPGFTITTEACDAFYRLGGKYPPGLKAEIDENISKLEKVTGKTFGRGPNPLLVSVRSGAAVSMPGMMDTVLNLGLNDRTLQVIADLAGNERFVWDAYRRLMQMFGDVVLGIGHDKFEHEVEEVKRSLGRKKAIPDVEKLAHEELGRKVPDTALGVDELKDLIDRYKKVYERAGKTFPQDGRKQLKASIDAVLGSWNNPRAVKYRQLHDIRGLLGTAVNVQTMVFGNLGETSGTGVAFTRNPSSGSNKFYGEYLMNAQGEDVVAGIRTPKPIETLGEVDAKSYRQLVAIRNKLEKHYRDMQDVEFTIEQGKLYMLQTRTGKRTIFAAVKMAVDMVDQRLISTEQAIQRIDAKQLSQLFAPIFDPAEVAKAQPMTKGLNASPGAASGMIALSAEHAEQMARQDQPVVLVRIETSPEDIGGMAVSQGVLTARGGMTSHAAVVARGMGTPCVAGAGDVQVNYDAGTTTVNGRTFRQGDCISIDGFTGNVYGQAISTQESEIIQVLKGKLTPRKSQLYRNYTRIMHWADQHRRLGVRANADTPKDTEMAVRFGAEGIGLCRTEHMFFEGKRIVSMRKMILADDAEGRERALAELLPLQRDDFIGIFQALKGRPATIRFLDPPLHEFLPQDEAGQQEMAEAMSVPAEKIKEKVTGLHEANPMLGHRGCRLGIAYPEITAMQARAVIEAAYAVPGAEAEIMIPLVGNVKELAHQKRIVLEVLEQIKKENKGRKSPQIKIGTMIEVPRGAITADEVAREAEFFSFGTNDLTQMGCGFSRDDAGRFLKQYVEMGIYESDPFQPRDRTGVGELVRIAVQKGRKARPDLKLGICGEHGGDPASVEFCHTVGLDYVSCSPYRVPVARLAAAQAAINHPGEKAKKATKSAKKK
ncbi:MAG: pyruvate, phosphate dikinase [Planctomycetota bacterium]|jgi:pyruvate,orthophosphate dikinase